MQDWEKIKWLFLRRKSDFLKKIEEKACSFALFCIIEDHYWLLFGENSVLDRTLVLFSV